MSLLRRALELLVSILGLIILFFPFAVIASFIKLDTKGPVFFRQKRAGKNGNPFTIWKFRTMTLEAPEEGFGYSVTENNPYITRVGHALREYGIDELPQLINVLMGDMSLVGPRPCLPWQAEEMDERQRRRFKVKPGITSLGVIEGRNSLSWQERIEHDLAYVRDRSLLLDLKILLKTPWVILVKREGVYGEGGSHSLASEEESDSGKTGVGEQPDA